MRSPVFFAASAGALLLTLALCFSVRPRSGDRANEIAPIEDQLLERSAPALIVQRAPRSTVANASPQDPGASLPDEVTPAFLRERYRGRTLAMEHPQLEQQLPDLVEVGECAVFLRLVDARTGAACASGVQLWRLDAPASETMSRGDQLVRGFVVPIEGLRVEGLAAGRYRLVVEDSGRYADDPAPFDVAGSFEEIEVSVALPSTVALSLALYDLGGQRLREAKVAVFKHGSADWAFPGPRWEIAMRRPLVVCEDAISTGHGGSAHRSGGRYVPRRVTADADGWFALGEFSEGTRQFSWPVALSVQLEGAYGARECVLRPFPDRTHWVTVACDPAPVLAALRLPDGSDGRAISGQVRLEPQALSIAPGEEAERWRDVPIEVTVRLTFDKPVRFTFTPRELPLAERRIE